MDYIAIIHKDSDSDYGVAFSPTSGLRRRRPNWAEEPRTWRLRALTGHIDVMHEAGLPVPDPSSLDEVMRQPDFQDGVAFLVTVNEPGKTVRVNITLTKRQLQMIDQQARAHGMTRSAFLVNSGLKMG